MFSESQSSIAVRPRNLLFQSSFADYIALTKPGIAAAVLMSAMAGFFLASPASLSLINWKIFFHTIFGTALLSCGAGTLNMLLEMEPDALMNRTKNRPLPSGRVQPEEAFFIGAICASLGVVHIASMVNLLSGFLAGVSLALYLVFYTPMKKASALCTVIGAVSGAIPPLIGWSAAAQSLNAQALSLFLILFVWQFPHILALAWMYREDYSRAGFKMVPLPDLKGSLTAWSSLVLSLALVALGTLPYWLNMSGRIYLFGSLVLGGTLVVAAVRFFLNRNHATAKKMFLASVFYIPLLLGLMVAGR